MLIILENLKIILISINIILKIPIILGTTIFLWESQFRIYFEMLGIHFSCVSHGNIIRNLASDIHWTWRRGESSVSGQPYIILSSGQRMGEIGRSQDLLCKMSTLKQMTYVVPFKGTSKLSITLPSPTGVQFPFLVLLLIYFLLGNFFFLDLPLKRLQF